MKLKNLLATTILGLLTCIAYGQGLIISELVDGPGSGGYPKYVEITNTSGSAVVMDGYVIEKSINGAAFSEAYKIATFTLPAGESLVITNMDNTATAQRWSDYNLTAPKNVIYDATNVNGNGDDAYRLTDGTNPIDVFGIEEDGTGKPWDYLDTYAYRNSTVTSPTNTFTLSEWTIPAINTLDGVTDLSTYLTPGTHTFGADTQAPTITFDPANAATNVAINTIPTITFNEAIRNIDDSEITDANVGLLVTLKEKLSGNSVTSTITINAEKKVITITPSANLTNDVEYVISLDPVEDANNNPTTLTTSTFTTISATTPVITLTSPNGSGKYYTGSPLTITWESTNIGESETINIEITLDGSPVQTLTSTNDKTETVTLQSGLAYGTTYKVKVSYSSTSDESDAAFTVVPVVNNIAAYKALTAGSVAKISGEVIVNFIRTANRNQKYVQDATGGLLIDDASGIITSTYNLYDGITGLEGTLTMYGTYTYELIPTVNSGASTSQGNTITPEVITLAQLNADHMLYQSKLVKVEDVTIKEADGTATFVASSSSSNYTMQNGGVEGVVRQAWKTGETDLIGAIIPTGTVDIVGIVGQYTSSGTTTAQLQPRALSDIILPTYTVTFNVTRNSTAVAGVSIAINNQTLTTDANGTASVDLANGTYSYTTTKEGYNEYSGSVTVNSAAQTVNIVLTTTGVNTNTFASLKAYPNPFSNEIRFEGASIARVTVTSIIGQVMIEEAVTGRNQISTEALPRGIYLVKFTNTKGETTLRKLVKE